MFKARYRTVPLTRFNPLNAELHPICHLPALLDAHHILYVSKIRVKGHFKPLNAELNPICHLLPLLGAHHILHVGRIRGNKLFYNDKREIKVDINKSSEEF